MVSRIFLLTSYTVLNGIRIIVSLLVEYEYFVGKLDNLVGLCACKKSGQPNNIPGTVEIVGVL